MGDARLSTAQKKKLSEQRTDQRKTRVSSKFRSLVAEADAIPLRAKTQYPTYIEGRTLHLIRGVATIEGISVQELIRQAIQETLDRRMSVTAKKKERVAVSRGS